MIASGGDLWGATANGALIGHKAQGSSHWEHAYGPTFGETGALALAHSGLGLLAAVPAALGEAPSIYESANHGADWTLKGAPVASATPSALPFGDVTSLAASGSTLLVGLAGGVYRSPSVLHALTGGLYRSVDGGATFSKVSAGIPDQPDGVDLVAPDVHAAALLEGNVALASVSIWSRTSPVEPYDAADNAIYRSTDGGATWTVAQTIGNRRPASHVQRFVTSGAHTYALSSEAVYRSSDEGAQWAPLPLAGLTPYDFVDVAEAGGTLVVVTSHSMYLSRDGGETAVPATASGQPDSFVQLATAEGRLYASTRSGVWWLTP